MKNFLCDRVAVCILLVLTVRVWPAQAADTEPSVAAPSVSERLASAREAIKAKDWHAALAALDSAVREEPRNAEIHNLLGYTYRKQTPPNLPRAFAHYRRALELDPRHKGAHEYIGEAFLMDKKPAEAERHLAALENLCGNKTCQEYRDLAKAIAEYKASHK